MQLPDEMGWLLKPVVRGMCKYSELLDGTLDISDVALMNEALDCVDENEARAIEASKTRR